MTLRTLTFDPAQYKLVPVDLTDEMQTVGAQAIRFDTTVLNKLWTGNAVYRAMLAAVPDTPPGVVEHSGEPVAWINYNVLTREERICRKPITALQPGVYTNTKLFTHPAPAPTQTCKGVNCSATDGVSHSPECFSEHDATVYGQPVERQELSDAAQAVIDRWDTPAWKDVPSTAEFINRLPAAVAKDRGQA